jgi:hypothetical protein
MDFKFNRLTGKFNRKADIKTSVSLQVISQDENGNYTARNGLIKCDRSCKLTECAQTGLYSDLVRTSIIRTMSFDERNLIFNIRDKV